MLGKASGTIQRTQLNDMVKQLRAKGVLAAGDMAHSGSGRTKEMIQVEAVASLQRLMQEQASA
jgi:hypothetical protein